MQSGKPVGATRELAVDQDEYNNLHIKDWEHEGVPIMSSVWYPDDYEIKQLERGAAVALSIIGVAHPPIHVSVVPNDSENMIPVSAERIIIEAWHEAVRKFNLAPGSHVETVVATVLNRIRGIDAPTALDHEHVATYRRTMKGKDNAT